MNKFILLLPLVFFSCLKDNRGPNENIANPKNQILDDSVKVYVDAKAIKGTFNITITQTYVSTYGTIFNRILGGGEFSNTLNFSFKVMKGDSIWVASKITKNPIYSDTKLEYSIKTDSVKLFEWNSHGTGIYNGWVHVK